MYNYKTLSKSQLIELVQILEAQLKPAITDAKEASKNYSTELHSQLPFEVGYLGGVIKTALETIADYKEYSK
jgi:hypothetical protein